MRINQAGYLGRCRQGPVVVIYPQGIWYRYTHNTALDEIIDMHLIGGKIVAKSLIENVN